MINRLSKTVFVLLVFLATKHAAADDLPFLVTELESGQILIENRANDKWYPASLTKLMTAYVTFRAIENNEIEDGSPVIISRKATLQPPSRMGYRKGVTLRIDKALEIIIIKSANDVSHALAEAVAGSVENFVARMNIEAKRLGLTNTRFANSNGLHSRQQFTSARDMAVLSVQILREFPQYAYLFEAAAVQTDKNIHYSYNLLLERFPGTTGMKTGFVCASGYNIVVSASRNARTLVAVVLGRSSQTDRAVTAARLLTEAFAVKTGSDRTIYDKPASPPAVPRNMRSILCTEQARAARYDPAPGNAKIESDFLEPRKKSERILKVAPGGVDAEPSDAYFAAGYLVPERPAVPLKSPGYSSSATAPPADPFALPDSSRIPLPAFRKDHS